MTINWIDWLKNAFLYCYIVMHTHTHMHHYITKRYIYETSSSYRIYAHLIVIMQWSKGLTRQYTYHHGGIIKSLFYPKVIM